MKSKAVYLILATALLFGFFSRFYKLQTNFIFGNDQAEDISKLSQMYSSVKNGKFSELPLIGEPGTYLIKHDFVIDSPYPVYSGVLYLYLLLPFAITVAFSPVGLVIVFAGANVLAIWGIYLAGKELFDEKTGVVAAVLFSASYYMNVFSRAIWTPSFIPVFVIFLIYLLTLIKNKGKDSLWPVYLFLLSAMSQTHNSGYLFAFLFILITLILRPAFPKKTHTRILSLFAFVLPVLPTIIYEFKNKFSLFPRIVNGFATQLTTGADGNRVISGIFERFWEFWASTINPLYFDTFFSEKFGRFSTLILGIFAAFAILSLLSVFITKRAGIEAKKIFLVYLIVFFPVTLFVKSYYQDPFPGIYALSGTSFSVIGAMPFLLLMSAFAIVNLWQSGRALKLLGTIFLTFYLIVNIFFTRYQIWLNTDTKYDYGTKIKITEIIGQDANGRKFNLLYDDPKDEGVEFVYLVKYLGYLPPVTYNGQKTIVSFFNSYTFSEGKTDLAYLISGSSTWNKYESDKKWNLIFQTERFRVYRANLP